MLDEQVIGVKVSGETPDDSDTHCGLCTESLVLAALYTMLRRFGLG